MKRLYGIVGTGGFAREVMPWAFQMLKMRETGFKIVFIDKNSDVNSVNGHPVMKENEFFKNDAEKYFNIAIADYKLREKIARRFIDVGIKPFSIIAPNVLCGDNNEIAEGVILQPFTIVMSNVKIGRFFHTNMHCCISHDCKIGDFVTLAPKVVLNGGVVVDDYAYIGTGTVTKQELPGKPIVIGKGAIVGMGAVVTKSVAPFTTVIGNPARIM